jgi:hypothetical protein
MECPVLARRVERFIVAGELEKGDRCDADPDELGVLVTGSLHRKSEW